MREIQQTARAMRFVAVKTAEQQAGQALHRVRSRLIKSRTALVNEVRGLLGEFGLVMPVKGVAACRRLTGWPRAIAEVLEDGENGLPGLMRQMLFQLSEETRNGISRSLSWTR